jgi:LacI family transcriptional regulator
MPAPLPPPRRPTLRAVAELAGVSHVTVSLALRNDPRITAPTRLRVQRAAEKLGYAPDPGISELMGRLRVGRARQPAPVIAYLGAVHPVYGVKDSPMARRVRTGAESRASALGYRIERFTLGHQGLTAARVATILRTRNIRGVILGPLAEDSGSLRLDWRTLAPLAVGFSLREPSMHRVASFAAHSMRLALQTLATRGRRRWGVYLREGLDARVDHGWLSTYLHAREFRLSDAPPIPPLITASWNRDAFVAWFREFRPDAIITIQLGVLDWLRELARVPEEAAFVHLDWSPEMGEVAGIDQMPERIGAAGVEQVAAQLSQHEYGLPQAPKTIYIEGVWREGRTAPQPV